MRLLIYRRDLLTALRLEEFAKEGFRVEVAVSEKDFGRLMAEFDPTHIWADKSTYGHVQEVVAKRGSQAKIARSYGI